MKTHENKRDRAHSRSKSNTGKLIAATLGALVLHAPAQAENGFEDAHSLRSLDIMLMVTALRCRSGQDDFQSEYHQFSATHSAYLSAAGRTLRRSFAASYGEKNPARALDRMGVKIANSYGDGHPWLSCAELQAETRDLSGYSDPQVLAARARYLLSAARPLAQPEAAPPQIAQADPVQITYNMTAEWEKRP